MPSENRLTRIDTHLTLFLRGKEIWQTTPTARTVVPLPNLPAYLSARVAISPARIEEFGPCSIDNAARADRREARLLPEEHARGAGRPRGEHATSRNFSISPGILYRGTSPHPWNSRESWPGTASLLGPPPGLIEKLRMNRSDGPRCPTRRCVIADSTYPTCWSTGPPAQHLELRYELFDQSSYAHYHGGDVRKARLADGPLRLGAIPMHIPDGLLVPGVAMVTGVVGAGGLGYSLRAVERRLRERTTPLMGMMAAFVFAAQMVNFPVGPGSPGTCWAACWRR